MSQTADIQSNVSEEAFEIISYYLIQAATNFKLSDKMNASNWKSNGWTIHQQIENYKDLIQHIINIFFMQMSAVALGQLQELSFQWLASRINDVSSCQGIVHQSPLHCLQEFTLKLLATGKVSFKYYLIFHAIPLVMRMRKCRNITQALKALTSTAIDYLKSILFLSFLVGLERGSLCLFLSFPQRYTPTSSKIIIGSALASSVAILFEESSRRKEIVYFVSAKAARSAYLVLKRTLGLKVQWEAAGMHILLMAGVYYVYHHKPQLLKFRNAFQLIFGDS